MLDAVAAADAVVMAAAVADFRPKDAARREAEEGRPARRSSPSSPPPTSWPSSVSETARPGPLLVGFAAETSDVEAAGREKLRRKHLDLLVANEVGRDGTGFGADTNTAALVAADGDDVALRDWTKRELARAIVRPDRAARSAPLTGRLTGD